MVVASRLCCAVSSPDDKNTWKSTILQIVNSSKNLVVGSPLQSKRGAKSLQKHMLMWLKDDEKKNADVDARKKNSPLS